MQELQGALKGAVKDLFNTDVEPELSRPDEQFGDYATNVAMQLYTKLNKNPKEIAVALAAKLHGLPGVAEVSIAGGGFINIKLTDEALGDLAFRATNIPKDNHGKEILVEFGDPNPFKEMHIGHLYSYVVGDAISGLLEASGATVRRLSYHGDVGLHVAKAIWGMQKEAIQPNSQTDDIGKYYAIGAKAYEVDPTAKAEIDQINQQIYKKADTDVNKLYEWGRQISLSYFADTLKDLNIKTDKSYFESQSADEGLKLVHEHIGSVFKQSEGAVIYEGEKAGLHTRVFITKQGLPTYEAKDLGLAGLKKKDYPGADRSLIITAHEQSEYFKVVLAALKEIDAASAGITSHVPHGFVSLSSGKMSSRTGEVYSAVSLLADVETAAKKLYPEVQQPTILAAVKYGFLKHRLGSDIIYDMGESVSLEGNSGPYLQYAYARARSILVKSKQKPVPTVTNLDKNERKLARKIGEYPEVVQRATADFMPHVVTTYLYELAQNFNRFYEASRIIGDERESLRLKLTETYSQVLKSGLNLLNIEAPERM